MTSAEEMRTNPVSLPLIMKITLSDLEVKCGKNGFN